MDREKKIVRTSILGILANVFLAAFKAVIGTLTNSIAVTLDAVNNLSDAMSSVITIIGARLAGRAPDKKHPMGYGRIEYLSASIIAVIVLYAGVTSLVESVKKILHPETPDYSAVALVIIAVAVLVKILLGRYVKHVGELVNSDSLIASGEDATLDSVISASTLVAAAIYLLWGLSLEAWLGAVISLVIIKSGLEMLRETLSEILGERITPETAKAIKATIAEIPEVHGAYDLLLHNYGPDRFTGSVHIEVADTLTADRIDALIRQITMTVYHRHDIILSAVGIYSQNTKEPEIIKMRETVHEIVCGEPGIRELHGFYVYEDKKIIRFDLVVTFDVKNRREAFDAAVKKVQEKYPDYQINAALDAGDGPFREGARGGTIVCLGMTPHHRMLSIP